jgi:ectoine hydroxylase-related dioxygenase (phytanoyl-CoA dioxygenase family)
MAGENSNQPENSTYRVSVEEYVRFREQGFLVIRSLVSQEEVNELNQHMDDLLAGRQKIQGATILSDLGVVEKPQKPADWLRAHMLHRHHPLHERFLLHPRLLDVLEALIGPDVLALQSMLFFKQPGQPGQGYHQDAYYIPTFPETLCGAWLSLTPATVYNGCLWFTPGTQHEPIYPNENGQAAALQSNIGDLGTIYGPSVTDESKNGLLRIARKYPHREVPVEANPGDVVFFAGHILHRSHANRADTPRRSFVGHYCNARSVVPWNHGEPFEGEYANYLHILARGRTHLPYAQPRFGTPCAANQAVTSPSLKEAPMSMMGSTDGKMTPTMHAMSEPED